MCGAALAIACGGDVTDDGDEGFGDGYAEGEPGAGDSEPVGQLPFYDTTCRQCGPSDCGMCAHEGGDAVYQCWDGRSPRSDMQCMQSGSVYHGAAGPYICWRCFN